MTRSAPGDFAENPTETVKPLPENLPEDDRDDYESELRRLMINKAARERVKQHQLELESAGLPAIPTQRLDEVFTTEPQGQDWLIEGLLQQDGSVVLSAQYKSGKTTLAMNLVHAVTTGKPFLGSFCVPEPLRVAYYDLELGFRTARKWFMEIQPDPTMVTYTNLKGQGQQLDVRSERWFDHVVEQLRRDQIDVVVIDPISAVLAAIGVMENENSEVRPLLDRFDAVAREAGCRGVVVVHHTGHDKSRARGASSFGDWPTAMWTLERDGDKPSQFRARGRDVYVERSGLVYDQNTRQLSKLVGPDDADAEYFRLRRGEQLTTAQVADELAISKHTAKRRPEDAGWEITQEAQGTIPAVWEYPNTADDRWAPDPFA